MSGIYHHSKITAYGGRRSSRIGGIPVDSGDVFLSGGISKGIGAVVFLGRGRSYHSLSFFAFVRSAQSGNREGQYKKSGGKNF